MYLIKKHNITENINYECEFSPSMKSVTFDFKIHFHAPGKVNTDAIAHEVNGKAKQLFRNFLTEHNTLFHTNTICKLSFSKNRLNTRQTSRYCGQLTVGIKHLDIDNALIDKKFEQQLLVLEKEIKQKLINHVRQNQ